MTPVLGGNNFFLEQLRSPSVGQIHINQREIKTRIVDALPGSTEFGRPSNLRPQPFQLRRELFAQQRLVFHNQYAQTSQNLLVHSR